MITWETHFLLLTIHGTEGLILKQIAISSIILTIGFQVATTTSVISATSVNTSPLSQQLLFLANAPGQEQTRLLQFLSSSPYLNATSKKTSNASKTLFARVVTLSPRFCQTTRLLHLNPLVTCSALISVSKSPYSHIKPSITNNLPPLPNTFRFVLLDKDLKSQPGLSLHYTSGRPGYGRRTFRFFAPEV